MKKGVVDLNPSVFFLQGMYGTVYMFVATASLVELEKNAGGGGFK